jgi:crossover junction endodeoxyribonuclease RusA
LPIFVCPASKGGNNNRALVSPAGSENSASEKGNGGLTVIDLPFPPSTNNLFINLKRGRMRSQKYEDWIQEAGYKLNAQKPSKTLGKVELFMTFCAPDKRKRDVSNLIKPIEDLLVKHGIIEADDSSIVRGVHASWSEAVDGCRVTVERVG